jgi:hypothetical protein
MNMNDWVDGAARWAREIAALTGWTRSTLFALLILVIGFLAALVLERVTRKIAARSSTWLSAWTRVTHATDTERVERAVGRTVFWIVLLLSVMAATETLELPVVTAWLSGVANFLARVAVAIFIAALGVVAARIARQVVAGAASSASVAGGERLGRLTQVAILIGTGLVAVEQVGIEVSFLKTTLLLVLGSLLGGAALAFGLGGRNLVANILSAHYVQKLYQVGQTVRIGDSQGLFSRTTETSVILECNEGDTAVPASEFWASRSTAIVDGAVRR